MAGMRLPRSLNMTTVGFASLYPPYAPTSYLCSLLFAFYSLVFALNHHHPHQIINTRRFQPRDIAKQFIQRRTLIATQDFRAA